MKSDLSWANLTGANLTGAVLAGANLEGAELLQATLRYVKSGGIIGEPASLPAGWSLKDGVLIFKDIEQE
jgi:uncharacterized protein YjbI with pentapeptide repeats